MDLEGNLTTFRDTFSHVLATPGTSNVKTVDFLKST